MYYASVLQQCESFIYGGCKGQVPFDTEEQCEESCEDPCKQLPVPGPCKAYIPSWFFNQKTRKCETFIWGGCGGSRPFKTLEACLKKCGGQDPCDLTPEDVLPPPGTITCQAVFESWYFNKSRGKCESFTYSGCSNLGPFKTEEDCASAKCICQLRPEDTNTGPITCQAFWTTWFFNDESGKCDKFSYSGCNPIAFESERKCLENCA